ncbi:MAG: sigma-54-dependent Fis family transcriptional regulator [Rhodothermales bacterium]|nr:sigma-54-dependent Fis family transcriptional regulator [Rhodothermales bacterium]
MDRESVQERFGIIGTSSAIKHVIDQVRLVARTEASVLIQGESGVGKELVAQAIHELGNRRHKPLTIVNCGAIPEGLIESELFGTEKGAYTGAVEKRAGYFEAADQGSIFLDEIGEMPTNAQVRLLRVLESGEYSRVGATTIRQTDARIIAATNKDLGREVEKGRFREDLYYRLSTVVISIPPLRKRKEDILPIFESFVHSIAQKYNTSSKRLTDNARKLLTEYRWPGNVRELRNVAERTIVMVIGNTIDVEHLRPHLRGVSAEGSSSGLVRMTEQPGSTESDRERELLYRALVELRVEIQELKQLVKQMAQSPGSVSYDTRLLEAPPREMIVYEGRQNESVDDFIEDASYELEQDEETPDSGIAREENDAIKQNGSQSELPTLEYAERELIAEALKKFKGNRRQSAKALGISERTLYRKIKEMEDDATAAE